MLYSASYCEPKHYYGQKISKSVPAGFKVDSKLQFLVPNANLLADWKARKIGENEYVQRYREQIKESWNEEKAWLTNLIPNSKQLYFVGNVEGSSVTTILLFS